MVVLAGELSKADEVEVEALEHEPPSRRRLGTLRAAARQSGDSDENDSEVCEPLPGPEQGLQAAGLRE
jgi:hypothetical protein